MIEYSIKKEWRIVKNEIPDEIVSFIESTFQIMEIRGEVGSIKGIKFEVRTKESNHVKPHVHAVYDGYSVSIAIETGEILAGNLPASQHRSAKKWVLDHTDELLGKWNDIAITATSVSTKSRLS